jgi:hypothetical protein
MTKFAADQTSESQRKADNEITKQHQETSKRKTEEKYMKDQN